MNANTALTRQAVRWLRNLSPAEQPFVGGGAPPPAEHAPTIADIDQTFPATTNTRLAAAVRLVSCFAAAQIVLQLYLAREPRLWLPFALLILFTVYVAALYWRTVRHSASQEPQVVYWVDTLWYLALTAMTGGSDSHFSFFLPFPLLFVSLRWGFVPGITMAVCSTIVLLLIGVSSSGLDTPALVADSLLPPIALLVLGYLIATWANSGLTLSRRLASLKEIDSQFNPRLNIEQIIDRVVWQLVTLYPIHKYALVLVEAGNPARVFRADLPDRIHRVPDTAAVELVNVLLRMASDGAVIYCGRRGLRRAGNFGFLGGGGAGPARALGGGARAGQPVPLARG